MNAMRKDPRKPDPLYSEPTQATIVRELLLRAGLGQREAARELEINERTMRGYCKDDKVPKVVILALERLIDARRESK